MNPRRWVISFSAFIAIFTFAARPSFAADAPATAPTTEEAPRRFAPDCAFTGLFRAELKDRRLDVAVVPPKKFEQRVTDGESFVVKTADSDEDQWSLDVAADSRRPDGGYVNFSIGCEERFNDRWASLRLTNITGGSMFSLVGAGRYARSFVTVTLTQDARLGVVHFSVTRQRRPGRGRPIHDFQAPDLLAMWNEHSAELRQFLVPLIKEAFGENLLRPAAGDVYLAFSTIPADADVTEKLLALLPQLDAVGSAERDAASAKLRGLGSAGVLAAARLDRSDLSPEQRSRLDAHVAHNCTLSDPAAAASNDPYFLADCLMDGDVRVRTSALAALRTMTSESIEFDVNGSAEARSRAAEEIIRNLADAVIASSTTRPSQQ